MKERMIWNNGVSKWSIVMCDKNLHFFLVQNSEMVISSIHTQSNSADTFY